MVTSQAIEFIFWRLLLRVVHAVSMVTGVAGQTTLQYKEWKKNIFVIHVSLLTMVKIIKKSNRGLFKTGTDKRRYKRDANNNEVYASTSFAKNGQKNNITKWQRLNDEEFEYLVKNQEGVQDIRDCHGVHQGARLLRPRPTCSADPHRDFEDDAETSTNRIFNMKCLLKFINGAASGHSEHNPSCRKALTWGKEIQQGLAWSETLQCDKCGYTTGLVKLFAEQKLGQRGRPPASINVQLQVGLSCTMISNSAFQRIMAICDIPPPGYTPMQHQANKINEKLYDISIDDMKNQRQKLRLLNSKMCQPQDTPIRCAIDSRYNTRLGAGRGYTPFQPATQQVTTLTEGMTGKNFIIGINVANKLCSKGMRKQNYSKHCHPHLGICSQNIPLDENIGDEKRAAKNIMQEIQSDAESSITVGYVTSDADSHGPEGLAIGQKKPVSHLIDTRHFGEAVKRAVDRTNFSKDAFPGKTELDKNRIKKNFAANFKSRCNAEFQKAYEIYGDDICVLKNKLTYAIEAQLACFSENCGDLCSKHSFCCSGLKDGNRWKHEYLMYESSQDTLSLSNTDLSKLRTILINRLGNEGVEKSKFNTNSQHLEALHRKYSSVNPSQVTWSRNAAGRLASAAHQHNHGLHMSSLLKLEALSVPINPSAKPSQSLKKYEKQSYQRLMWSKTSTAKHRRAERRRSNFTLHAEKRHEVTYKKDLLLLQSKTVKNDHCYTNRSKHMDHSYVKYSLRPRLVN